MAYSGIGLTTSLQDPYLTQRRTVSPRRHADCVDTERSDLVAWVAAALTPITPGQFLLLEYLTDDDLPVEPYAQAALEPGGWHCEVVSASHLPSHRWPLRERALTRAGWRPPAGRTANWWQPDVALDSAAGVLVDALWTGRVCTDIDRFAVSVGTFPAPRGGGEPMTWSGDVPLVV
jgi:hypothetical protein